MGGGALGTFRYFAHFRVVFGDFVGLDWVEILKETLENAFKTNYRN